VIIFDFFLIIVGGYLTLYVLYCLMLFAAHLFIKREGIPSYPPKVRLGIIIPAHNEELFLGELLKSVNRQSYPSDMFKAIVVADNCTDQTAQIGLANKAIVMERFDNQYRGKGYAIKHALEKFDRESYDAMLIVDADSIMSKDVLQWLNQAILEGSHAIQCYNGVANPEESWFTRLLDVSRTVGNEIYHPAKQRLGLSSYLMGNGMCFSKDLLLKYGWDAFTIGEDWEYYAKIINNGESVAYSWEAKIYHLESSRLRQATPQRMRWSSGRFAIAFRYGFGIFLSGIIKRDIKKIDASTPLIFPNPSLGMNITIFGFILSYLLSKPHWVEWFLALILIQIAVFCFGIIYTKNRLSKVISIFVTPLFLLWKLVIDIFAILGFGGKKWVRTERN